MFWNDITEKDNYNEFRINRKHEMFWNL